MTANRSRKLISTLLILVAIALLYPIYNTPVWWVSLDAPNYPKESFPLGVRIHFHANGVFTGCGSIAREEIHDVIERLPRGRGHLADQLTRASTSIVLNIADGCREVLRT